MEKKEKWFLGGTCGKTQWRDELIPILEKRNIDYFNPLIRGRGWIKSDEENEYIEKNEKCNVHCYVITPEIKGVFSIAEIVNSCWEAKTNTNCVKHVYFVTLGYFDNKAFKRMNATKRLCKNIAGDKVSLIHAKYISDIFEEIDENNE